MRLGINLNFLKPDIQEISQYRNVSFVVVVVI